MNDMLWIFDRSPSRRHGIDRPELLTAAASRGFETIVVDYENDGLPDLPLDPARPTLLRGSIGFLDAMARQHPEIVPGGFNDPDAFRYERLEVLGPARLNQDARITTLGAFRRDRARLEAAVGADGALFVRPASSGKSFNGFVVPAGEQIGNAHWRRFRRWNAPDDDLEIVVSQPRAIEAEWRCVVLDGEVIASRCGNGAAPSVPS